MPTLDWVNRDDAFRIAQRVPTRVLRPHAAGGVHGDASQGNLLVQGDNLEALKALLPFYRGRVKCIFIDPPYNTKSAFEHYDDNLEHSQWLTMILPRLQLLREFLREDGSIWVTFPFRKRFKSELGELVPTTIWLNEEVGNNREAKQEITRVFGRDDILDTPKLWLPTSFGRLYPDFVCERPTAGCSSPSTRASTCATCPRNREGRGRPPMGRAQRRQPPIRDALLAGSGPEPRATDRGRTSVAGPYLFTGVRPWSKRFLTQRSPCRISLVPPLPSLRIV